MGTSFSYSFTSFSGHFLESLRVEFYTKEHQCRSPHDHVAHVYKTTLQIQDPIGTFGDILTEKVRDYVIMLLVQEQGNTIRRRAKALSNIDEIVVAK